MNKYIPYIPLLQLRKFVGEKAYRHLRRGGLLQVWRRTSPHNWFIETKKQILWHSDGWGDRPNLSCFDLVSDSGRKIGDGLPSAARSVIGGSWNSSEQSWYKLKEELLYAGFRRGKNKRTAARHRG